MSGEAVSTRSMKALTASAPCRVAVGLLGLFRNTTPAPLLACAMASRSSFSAASRGMALTGVPISSAYPAHSS